MFSWNRIRILPLAALGLLSLAACGADNLSQQLEASPLGELVTAEDTPVGFQIRGTSLDNGDADLTVKILTPPAHGTLSAMYGGEPLTVTYTPDPYFSGTDEFFYQITTGDERSEVTGIGSITVQPVANEPLISVSAEGDEDTLIPLDITALLADTDGSETLSPVVISGIPDGTFLSNGSYFGNGVYSLTQNQLVNLKIIPQLNRDEGFEITVEATATETATGETATTTVIHEVVIHPVADAPVPFGVTDTVDEDDFVDILLDASDTDTGDMVSLTAINGLSNGTVTDTDDNPLVFPIAIPAMIRYTPDPDFDGVETFTFSVTDTHNLTSTGNVTITVIPSGDSPVATPQAVTLFEDSTISIVLTGTDPDTGDAVSVLSIQNGPATGILTTLSGNPVALPLAAPITVRYVPDPDSDMNDSFEFTVRDIAGNTGTATVTISITPVNDPPRAIGSAHTLDQDTFVDFTLDGTDPDTGDTLFIQSILVPPSSGSITDQFDAALTLPSATITQGLGNGLPVRYRPNGGFFSSDLAVFRVQDSTGLTHTAVVNFTVNRVPVPPVAQAGVATVNEDSFTFIQLTATDSDIIHGDQVFLTNILNGPTNGTVTDINGAALSFPIAMPATVRYTPNANYSGGDAFDFEVTDTEPGASSTATVTITVDPINDAPFLTNVPASITCAAGDTPVFQATGDDIDTNPATLTFDRSGGTCAFGTVAADGTVGGTCAVLGSLCTIGIRVSDGEASATAMLTIGYNTRFVRTPPAGSGNGSSWANGTANIQQAINDLAPVPGGQVWVRQGTYRSSGTGTFITMTDGVSLYGGFAGTEGTVSQRPSTPFVHSVLSGDTNGDGLFTPTDSRRVIQAASDADIDGFIITGGNGVLDTGMNNTSGAGIGAEYVTNLVISNVIIRKNQALGAADASGAAIYAEGSELWVLDSVILDNHAYFLAGAIAGYGSTLEMDNVVVSGNTSQFQGAAIFMNAGSTAAVFNSLFSGNGVTHNGGAIYNHDSDLLVINSTFRGNSAGVSAFGSGGAIFSHNSGGGGATLEVINATFSGNDANAGNGGGIFNSTGSTATITNSAFYGNTGGSGAVDWVDAPAFVANCADQNLGGGNTQIFTDPFLHAASGQVFLDPSGSCVDTGSDALAGAAFAVMGGLDWTQQTTNRDTPSTLDASPADPGRHHVPYHVWIKTFEKSGGTTLSWTTNAASSCVLSGGVLTGPLNVALNSSLVPGGNGNYTLTCQGVNGPVTATISLP